MVKKGIFSLIAVGGVATLLVVMMSTLLISGSGAATCNERTDDRGRLSPGESVHYEGMFCSDPGDSLVGLVTWGKHYRADQDLAVVVTSPSGMQIVFDDGPSSAQTFIVFGPLEEGMWTVDVVNVGSRAVRYDIAWAFG